MIFQPHNWAELIAAIICTACLLYKPSVINRWFVWFLWLTFLLELTGKWLKNDFTVKMPLYNIYNAIEMIACSVFFMKVTINSQRCRFQKILLVLVLLFWAINFIFIQRPFIYNNLTANLCAGILCFFGLLYYYDIVADNGYSKKNIATILFTTGIFIYYVGTLNVFAAFNKLATTNPGGLTRIYKLITHNLSVIMYFFFSAGLIVEVVKGHHK